MNKYIAFIALIFLLLCGCNNRKSPVLTNKELDRIVNSTNIELVESADKVTLMVAGQEIDSDEIIYEPVKLSDTMVSPVEYLSDIAKALEIDQFKIQAKEFLQLILRDKILDILLYKDAKRQFGENIEDSLNNAAESELRRFIQAYGNDIARADEILKLQGLDRDSFMEIKKSEILRQWYISSQTTSNEFIPYRKLKQKYDDMKDEYFALNSSIEFRLIDIQPDQLEVVDPNTDRLDLALSIVEEILNKLKAGEDFAELAKQYSNGFKKDDGGLWLPLDPDSLAEPYNLIAQAVKNLNPGEISKPILEDKHIFIVKLENKTLAGYEPFEKVQDKVKEALQNEQKTSTAINELNDRLIQQLTLPETNTFIDFCIKKIHQICNQN